MYDLCCLIDDVEVTSRRTSWQLELRDENKFEIRNRNVRNRHQKSRKFHRRVLDVSDGKTPHPLRPGKLSTPPLPFTCVRITIVFFMKASVAFLKK